MRTVKLLLAAAALSGGMFVTAASAMPIAPVPSDAVANVEQVRLVCNVYGRCWRQPNYYYGGYGYYGPRRFYGGYAYRRGYGRRW